MLNIKATLQLLVFFISKLALCDILVYNADKHEVEIEFKDIPAKFGDPIPADGLKGLVVYSNPADACGAIDGPPLLQNYTGMWIVLIKRYGCQFEQKTLNAQKAGFDAVIVHNVESSVLKPMAADNPVGITIPSVFIGSESGLLLKNNYLYNKGYYVLITDDTPFNFTSQLLIIFSLLIGFCFSSLIFFLIVKCFNDRRRQRRNCLPKSCLREIAIHKFKRNDPYELCAICLEEYVENDKLRVLPCSHAYHSKCIDPWLTKNKRVCPVCKRKVFTSGEVVDESDSDTDDETRVLVRSSGNTTNAGTFTSPAENPLRRWSSSDSGSDFHSVSSAPAAEYFYQVREKRWNTIINALIRRSETAGPSGVNVAQEHSINSEPSVAIDPTLRPGRASRQRSRNEGGRC